MKVRTAIIIGAGPAGLTAALELLTRTDIRPIVLEKSSYMGGISRTVNYKGNRIDIGGHRFFSKSDRVMQWWLSHLPAQARGEHLLGYQGQRRTLELSPATGPQTGKQFRLADDDRVMLIRPRKSRIYFLRRFFDYPIQLSRATIENLGLARTARIAISYARAVLWPIRRVENLEQFFINRFGRELYRTFFKSYTEKVWGVPCSQISAEWGQQRIKGLSVRKAIVHFLRQVLGRKPADVAQKGTETSLIEQFLYPKFGPGQMWEEVARKVRARGVEIVTEFNVTGVSIRGNRVLAVSGTDADGRSRTFTGDYFFSTMPVQELTAAFDVPLPPEIDRISRGLVYRDFITVGLLLKKLAVKDKSTAKGKLISDNWIYIQEPEVMAGRLQIFNNWSPHMVADPSTVWLGVEYFCKEGDELWNKTDAEMMCFAVEELTRIDIISPQDVLDGTVLRMPKTYPAYFGTYSRFAELRQYLDGFENLFLIGRNGMHRYNNQDHSMLTAMVAVDNIVAGITDKSNLWQVNTEEEYHETVQRPREQESAEAVSAEV